MRARLAKGAGFVVLGRITGSLLQFAGTLILVRLLLPDDFGLVAFATAVLGIVKSVTDMSLSSALIQLRSLERAHLDTAFTLNVARGLLLTLLLAGAAFPLQSMMSDQRTALLLIALSPLLMLDGLANPRLALLTKDLVFWQQFLIHVAQKLSSALVSVGFALVFRNYWALVAGALASQVLTVAISYVLAPYRPRFAVSRYREMFSFSVWLTLGMALNQVNWRIDSLLIGSLSGKTTLGYYSMGDNLANMPTREATMPLYATLFPAFARVADSQALLAKAYSRAQALLTAVALPLGVGTALVAAPLVPLALGDKWLPAIIVMQVLAPTAALQTIGSLAHPLGMAVGRTKLLFQRDLAYFMLRVPIIGIGMYVWGLPGALFGRAATVIVENALNMSVARSITGLSYGALALGSYRTFLSIGAMVGVVSFLPAPANHIAHIALKVAIGGLVYTGAHCGLWLLAGRPEGPEGDILGMAGRFLPRSRERSS